MARKLWCYPTLGKKKALRMSKAFATGCGGEVATVGHPHLNRGPAFFYGWTEHTVPLIRQCQGQGIDWYYADNAYYFGRGKFFRVTKNALMHDGSGNAGPSRFRKFGIEVKPWRQDGRHILITTQSELFYPQRLGTTRAAWTSQVIDELRRHSDREIVICDKPPVQDMGSRQAHAPEFEAHLLDAWAMVTYSSSTSVKALLEGVPVFSLATSMASVMGLDDLGRIEEPIYPDGREQWMWNLAANQWTFAEMRSGACWRALNGKAAREPEIPMWDAKVEIETEAAPAAPIPDESEVVSPESGGGDGDKTLEDCRAKFDHGPFYGEPQIPEPTTESEMAEPSEARPHRITLE